MASALTINAQEKAFSNHINVGLSKPLLSGGYGVSIGFNSSYSISEHFSMEGQISYNYTKITHAFISGNKGYRNQGNLLVGGRLYFNKSTAKTRYYMNALVGGGIIHLPESLNGSNKNPSFNLGFSSGLYVEKPKFIAGIALEAPMGFIAKIGYKF